ncbi:MAG TPA: ABC transporter ATP-binding protein [Polyangiaceae bacterium]|nr:ABC transporter ATP-binding protein [Polyangiaceae bacterium]
MSNDVILQARNVAKVYERGGQSVNVLNSITLDVPRGDYVALMGPSGSGKTTLLNIIGGLDSPTSGSVVVDGTDISALSDQGLAAWRSANIGFIFQQYNLLPVLTALENVEFPLLLFKMGKQERRRRALAALELVGLAARAHHFPRQMSGGEEQRTSIARAMVTDPKLIIADEPTGNLDAAAAANILDLIERLNRDLKKTILMVTHDPNAGKRAKRLARLYKGDLSTDPSTEAAA